MFLSPKPLLQPLPSVMGHYIGKPWVRGNFFKVSSVEFKFSTRQKNK